FYATHPKDVRAFLSALKRDNLRLSYRLWECAAGAKHIAQVLEDAGHEVLSTDLIPRAPGVLQHDFISPLFLSAEVRKELDHPKRFNGDIITNPPYKHALEFITTGLTRLHSGSCLYLLLPVRYLEGNERYNDVFSKTPPKYIYQYVYRIKIAKGAHFAADSDNAVSYCWIVFEKGYSSGMFYYYAKEKHNPNLFIFVSMCQGLSKINGVAWHEIARKIVENDYKRGDKL
ncbi:MAG: hypothetical protein EBV86_17900, partial [Marivivens sp.]|nr:hypothetical protein [Marivivens sp.]